MVSTSAARNEAAYSHRWRAAKSLVLMRPHLWRELAPLLKGGKVLEIGAGLRPTAPPRGSYFADISKEALAVLERAGGHVITLTDGRIPFEAGALAGVLAFEVLEHVEEDASLLAEVARSLRPGGLLVCSVPLRMAYWSRLDDEAAHVRRYEPEELFSKLRAAGFSLRKVEYRYGRPSRLADMAAAWSLRAIPRVTNGTLQRIVFPIQSAVQRRFGRMKWANAADPVPAGATGICVLAAHDEGGATDRSSRPAAAAASSRAR